VREESELVRRAAGGDREAFGELAEGCRPWLRALCHGHVSDPWAVDDLVQETLVLAFRDLGQLRHPGAFRPWLGQVACNVCGGHLRRRRSRPEVLVAELPEAAASFPVGQHEVEAALGRAGEEEGELLRLHYVEGFTVAEMAAKLSHSAAGIRSRLYRARLRLRKEMAAMGEARARAWRLRTILLVEPDEAMCAPLAEGLCAAGYEVVVLPTGEAAIAAVREGRGQMLILDTRCGEPHWLEVMGLVRTDPYGVVNVPICTLVDQPATERELRLAWHAGAEVCLSRPPSIERLLSYLQRLQETWGEGEKPAKRG